MSDIINILPQGIREALEQQGLPAQQEELMKKMERVFGREMAENLRLLQDREG